MPLIESQPDALAMVYARSLLQMAESRGGRPAVEAALGELEEVLELARGNARFNEFLSSRAIQARKRGESIARVLGGRVSDLTLHFLLVVNAKERLSRLPSIVAALDGLVQEKYGRVEVDVYTAEPLDGEGVRRIQGRLGAILGKDVVVHPYVEDGMIGGVKMRIGDQLVDASVATQLRKMRERLSVEGDAALKAKISRIIEG